MAISREKKQKILQTLIDGFRSANMVVFVNFHGLDVATANEMRKILRKISVKYVVAKKTLIKKALEEAGMDAEGINLEGEIALAFAEGDSVLAAQELNKFAKKKKIKIEGGIFENRAIGRETVVMLANIPPREVLLSKLVNVLNSPIQGAVSALNGIIRNFVVVLGEVQKKRS